MTKSLLLAVLCALAAAREECWSMGETCGDDAKCSGMGTHCGDGSECSGSSTQCGANSVCTGMDSQCGPGSHCTGLGAKCEGGSQHQTQSGDEEPTHFKKEKEDKPMTWKPMHFKPIKTVPPKTVFVHGCDQGDVCSDRPDAAQSNGVTVCCQEGCTDCSASTSQSGDVLTATCVCNKFATPKPTEKPTEKPKPKEANEIKEMPKVNAKGCEMGSACQGRPGAAQAGGMAFCCPEGCAHCMVYGAQQDGVLTAMCMCGLTSELAQEPEEPEARAEPEATKKEREATKKEEEKEPEASAEPEATEAPANEGPAGDIVAGTAQVTNFALGVFAVAVWVFVVVAACKQHRKQSEVQQPLLSA